MSYMYRLYFPKNQEYKLLGTRSFFPKKEWYREIYCINQKAKFDENGPFYSLDLVRICPCSSDV